MVDQNAKVTKNGQILTARVWGLIDYINAKYDVDLIVAQGGFKGGDGASASAGTHDVGDVVDFSVRNLTEKEQLDVNYELRCWYGDAWIRSPEYGWTSTGPHIHCVMEDSFYGLSPGAKQQVVAYNNKRNGLANNGADPFRRPMFRSHFDLEDDMPTAQEVADALLDTKVKRIWDGKEVTVRHLLNTTHYYATNGGSVSTIPATSSVNGGLPSVGKRILEAASNDGQTTGSALSDADVDKIAVRVADLLAARLQS